MSKAQSTVSKLEELKESYAKKLTDKFDLLGALLNELFQAKTNEEYQAALEQISSLAHKLSGTAGTYGYIEISNHSRILESHIRDMLKKSTDQSTSDGLSREEKEHIEWLVHSIRSSDQSKHNVDISMFSKEDIETSHITSKLIYLLEDDDSFAQAVHVHLSLYGYKVKFFTSAERVLDAFEKERPAAVLVDLAIDNEDEAGISLIQKLQAKGFSNVPVIIMTGSDDFGKRLKAVRYGAKAYITKPIDFQDLQQEIEININPEEDDPPKVLIVDDDEHVSSYYQTVLEGAGVNVEVLLYPEKVIEVIARFQPDLIVTDIHMPGCNGFEMVNVIRQHRNYSYIPVIYLSVDYTSETKEMAVLNGDDFFLKPVNPSELVVSVYSRAKRAKLQKDMFAKDSMTGLYNHKTIKELLAKEMNKISRNDKTCAIALIDIDNFKSINDNLGHTYGDKAIMALSRLLQKRFRKSDHIGRYGGDEFFVVLPETDQETAGKLFEELSNDYKSIQIGEGKKKSELSLSIGIYQIQLDEADKPVEEVINEVDKAMYDAKKQGKGRISYA